MCTGISAVRITLVILHVHENGGDDFTSSTGKTLKELIDEIEDLDDDYQVRDTLAGRLTKRKASWDKAAQQAVSNVYQDSHTINERSAVDELRKYRRDSKLRFE